jgi:hypothetical protein
MRCGCAFVKKRKSNSKLVSTKLPYKPSHTLADCEIQVMFSPASASLGGQTCPDTFSTNGIDIQYTNRNGT